MVDIKGLASRAGKNLVLRVEKAQMRMCFVELWAIVRLVVRGSLVFVGGFVDPGGTTLNSLKIIVLSHHYQARC